MLISMKFKNIFVSLILSAVFCTNAFAYDGVNLNINGKDITSEVAPRLINERTMVPVRAILEEIRSKEQLQLKRAIQSSQWLWTRIFIL